MRNSFYYKINKWLSKKYLAWAEILPDFNGGMISDLQSFQRFNRNEADRAFEDSRIPVGTEIDLLSFTMFEMFNLEDFESIKPGLLRMFSKSQDTRKEQDLVPSIDEIVGNSLRRGWTLLGVIYPETRNFYGAPVTQMIPELPSEVEFINLRLFRLSASIIILTAEVHLKKIVIDNMKLRRNQKYLPEIRFEKMFPLKSYDLNHHILHSNDIMREKVTEVLDNIREKVEYCLKSVFVGFFGQYSRSKVKQPIIEMYSITDFPINIVSDDAWNMKNRSWLASFGIDVWENLFASNNCIFAFSKIDRLSYHSKLQDRHSFQLIINQVNEIEKSKKMRFVDYRYGLSYRYQNLVDDIIPLLITFQFLEVIKDNMSFINRDATNIIKRRKFKKYVQLSSIIQHEYFLLGRIRNEYNTWKKEVTHYKEHPLNLRYAGIGSEKINVTLFEQIIELCDLRMESIWNQLNYIKESFSDKLILLNIMATYRIQHISVIFTILGVILALLTFITLFPEIKKILGI